MGMHRDELNMTELSVAASRACRITCWCGGTGTMLTAKNRADEEIENKVTDDQGRCMMDNCDGGHAALYKSIAARLNYVSPDRPDLQ